MTYLNRVTILENKGSVEKQKKQEIVDNLYDKRESHKKQVSEKLSNLRDRLRSNSKQLEQTKTYGKEQEIGETFA